MYSKPIMTKIDLLHANRDLSCQLIELRSKISTLEMELTATRTENRLNATLIKGQEDSIKFERNRLGQAIDAVETVGQAVGAAGRLIHRLCDDIERKIK